MKSKFENLTVRKLTTTNVKRIRAVEIEPDGNLVVVSGRNSQGKSSFIDSLFLTLTGAQAGKTVDSIIRDGEEVAHVVVELGGEETELIVKKTWGATKVPKLQVMDTDGNEYKKGQTLLDMLIAKTSFDPLQFLRSTAKDQIEGLMTVCGKGEELRELDETRAALYESRTDLNRELERCTTSIASMPSWGDEYKEPVIISELVDEINVAKDKRREMQEVEAKIETVRASGVAIEEKIHQLKEQIKLEEEHRDQVTKNLEELDVQLGEVSAEAHKYDLDEMTERLETSEEHNFRHRQRDDLLTIERERERFEGLSRQATADIAKIDEDKRQLLMHADMPIAGLGYDDSGVMVNGVPLKDCSSSEQLQISTAIAIASNRAIKIIRIEDGALLDSDGLALVAKMAEESGCQIWVEMVDESGEMGVVIEDGMLAGHE